MLKVLIIPEKSESFAFPSIKVASETLGIGYHRLRYAIATGRALKMGDKKFYVDYELDLSDIDLAENPSKRANVSRGIFEMKILAIPMHEVSPRKFSTVERCAEFFNTTPAVILNRLETGQPYIRSKGQEWYFDEAIDTHLRFYTFESEDGERVSMRGEREFMAWSGYTNANPLYKAGYTIRNRHDGKVYRMVTEDDEE